MWSRAPAQPSDDIRKLKAMRWRENGVLLKPPGDTYVSQRKFPGRALPCRSRCRAGLLGVGSKKSVNPGTVLWKQWKKAQHGFSGAGSFILVPFLFFTFSIKWMTGFSLDKLSHSRCTVLDQESICTGAFYFKCNHKHLTVEPRTRSFSQITSHATDSQL